MSEPRKPPPTGFFDFTGKVQAAGSRGGSQGELTQAAFFIQKYLTNQGWQVSEWSVDVPIRTITFKLEPTGAEEPDESKSCNDARNDLEAAAIECGDWLKNGAKYLGGTCQIASIDSKGHHVSTEIVEGTAAWMEPA